MSKYTVVAVLVLCVLLLYLSWRALMKFLMRAPRYRRLAGDDLSKAYRTLLYRGYDGGFLVIETSGGRFIQYSKYVKGKARVGLKFDFPLAKWSESYFARLKSQLEDRDIDYQVQETGGDKVRAFLRVDLGQDLERAAELTSLTLFDVFNVKPDERISFYYGNISPLEERVGF